MVMKELEEALYQIPKEQRDAAIRKCADILFRDEEKTEKPVEKEEELYYCFTRKQIDEVLENSWWTGYKTAEDAYRKKRRKRKASTSAATPAEA